MASYKLSQYTVFSDTVNPQDAPGAQKCVLYSTMSNRMLVIPEPTRAQLQSGETDTIRELLRNELIRCGMLVPYEADEFAEVVSENGRVPRNLLLSLHTKSGCQAGCSSCVATDRQETYTTIATAEKMTAMAEGLLSGGGFESFRVVWSGGEPLEQLHLLEAWSHMNIAIANQYKVPYQASMVTSGVLLEPAVFKKLFFNHHIHWYQLTLDGTRAFHDARCREAGKEATYDTIINNIRAILDKRYFTPYDGLVFQVNVNADSDNCASITDLLEECAGYGFQNRVTFRFSRRAAHPFSPGKATAELEPAVFAEWEIEYEMRAAELGFAVAMVPARRFEPCFATGAHSYIADVQGTLHTCQAFPYMPETSLQPDFVLAGTGDITTQKQHFRNWFSRIAAEKGACYTCNLLPICGGGCQVKWAGNDPGCPSFKYNIKDRLLLNYLTRKTGQAVGQ